jgi:hypothetical protein
MKSLGEHVQKETGSLPKLVLVILLTSQLTYISWSSNSEMFMLVYMF